MEYSIFLVPLEIWKVTFSIRQYKVQTTLRPMCIYLKCLQDNKDHDSAILFWTMTISSSRLTSNSREEASTTTFIFLVRFCSYLCHILYIGKEVFIIEEILPISKSGLSQAEQKVALGFNWRTTWVAKPQLLLILGW